jgi:prepilin-type N-terminal cleavage/methylation domain-containing protein/prepilin-type processing-associated H-X9-DG protein
MPRQQTLPCPACSDRAGSVAMLVGNTGVPPVPATRPDERSAKRKLFAICGSSEWARRPFYEVRNRADQAGFTLVELLIVIGIIAVLIAILLPALNKAQEAGKAIQCASNMRTIGQQMMIYISENKGVIPPAGIIYPPSPGASFNNISSWDVLLKSYANIQDGQTGVVNNSEGEDFSEIKFYQCPDDTFLRTWSPAQYNKRSYVMVAAQPRYAQDGISYPPTLGTGMMTDVSAAVGTLSVGQFPGANPGFVFLKMVNVPDPTNTLLLAEQFGAANVLGHMATYSQVNNVTKYGASVSTVTINTPFDQFSNMGSSTTPIHSNKWNYLMCDGSVQRLHPIDTLDGVAATNGVWNGTGTTNTQWYLSTDGTGGHAIGFSNKMWTIRTDD